MVRISLVCCLLCFSIYAVSQNNNHSSESPAIKAYQAKRISLQGRGAKALNAEYAREKAPSWKTQLIPTAKRIV